MQLQTSAARMHICVIVEHFALHSLLHAVKV